MLNPLTAGSAGRAYCAQRPASRRQLYLQSYCQVVTTNFLTLFFIRGRAKGTAARRGIHGK